MYVTKCTSRVEKYTFHIGGTLSKIFLNRKIEKINIFFCLKMAANPLK
jgi:hypothetical protein